MRSRTRARNWEDIEGEDEGEEEELEGEAVRRRFMVSILRFPISISESRSAINKSIDRQLPERKIHLVREMIEGMGGWSQFAYEDGRA